MPWPVAALLNRPSMTVILFLNGSSTDNVLLSFIDAPEPSALQWSSLMPFPMNNTANRFGNPGAGAVSAKARKDSSHGNATVTPAPRRTARRENPRAGFRVDCGILLTSLLLA